MNGSRPHLLPSTLKSPPKRSPAMPTPFTDRARSPVLRFGSVAGVVGLPRRPVLEQRLERSSERELLHMPSDLRHVLVRGAGARSALDLLPDNIRLETDFPIAQTSVP